MTWSSDWLGPVLPEGGARSWLPGELALDPVLADAPELDIAVLPETLAADALQSAFEEGRAEGLTEGRTMERTRVDDAVAALSAATTELEAMRDPWLRQVETQLVALATAIARHVLEQEVRLDPGLLADLVRRALAEFPLDEPVRIRVHPENLSALGERKLAPGRQVQWVADARLAPGGCVVEGPRRIVDGRIEHVLERIYRALAND